MDKKDIFKDYIQNNDVLVVDKNSSSRSRLLKIMSDLGCKRHMIHTAGNLTEAADLLQTKNIGVVLSDYFIGGGSGFDLFKMVREKFPEKKELCLILVTANISQTAVAKAAEEDVDSFVIKPYTVQSIQENLISTIASKVKPEPYIVKIEEGKELLKAQKYAEAQVTFTEALTLHSKPALALFYIGQVEYILRSLNNAEGSYSKGLAFNSIHYKCLVGLYDMFKEQEKWNEAYHVVKKVAKYFPANPDRLAEIVRLAIRTQNYDDMQMYYEIFTSLDERTEGMINYIGAGMFITGKFKLQTSAVDEAIKYFDNIAVSCSEFAKFTRATIITLIEFGHIDAAEKYISRFPAGSDQDPDFLICDYLLLTHKLKNASSLVKRGLDLYNRGIKDYNCMNAMVKAMESCKYNAENTADFKAEMEKLWPEKFLNRSAA